MATGSDEQALVAGLHGDDPGALATLFDRYGDRVHNHCFRQLADWTEAEDATSSVFLEVWRHRHRVRLHDGSALPWLYGVATNVCRNAGRSRRRYLRAVGRLPRPAAELDHAEAVTDRLGSEARMREVLARARRAPRPRARGARPGRLGRAQLRAGRGRARRTGRHRPLPPLPGPRPAHRRHRGAPMTEPPAPERPLPDEARARIRAELLAHAHENRSSAPRWAVPLSRGRRRGPGRRRELVGGGRGRRRHREHAGDGQRYAERAGQHPGHPRLLGARTRPDPEPTGEPPASEVGTGRARPTSATS